MQVAFENIDTQGPIEVSAAASFVAGASLRSRNDVRPVAICERIALNASQPQAGKDIWIENAIDEFIITVMPTFIGDGIPLIAPRHRDVPLRLVDLQRFPDDVVQLHYSVQQSRA